MVTRRIVGTVGGMVTMRGDGRLRAAGVALVLFGLVSVVVAGWFDGRPLGVDAALHAWSVEERTRGAVVAARVVSASGFGVWAMLLAALAGILRWRAPGAPLGLAILLGGQAVRTLTADTIARARPPFADWAGLAGGQSFPSGHTFSATVLAVLLAGAVRRRDARVLIGLWAVAVGATRVVLGVHWATDVLAGWAFGLAWTLGALWLVRRLGRVLARRRGSGEGAVDEVQEVQEDGQHDRLGEPDPRRATVPGRHHGHDGRRDGTVRDG